MAVNPIIEICCPSKEAAFIAEKAKAGRIELCRDLETGGLTPCGEDILTVAKSLTIPVNVLIRPREGNFVYTEAEVQAMLESIRFCGLTGKVSGVVIGALKEDGSVDTRACEKLISLAREYGMSVTFHRAIDEPGDIMGRLEQVLSLGVDRILSSGGAPTAEIGADTLSRMAELAGSRAIIMPGCGVTPDNAVRILEKTHAREIHGSRVSIIKAIRES